MQEKMIDGSFGKPVPFNQAKFKKMLADQNVAHVEVFNNTPEEMAKRQELYHAKFREGNFRMGRCFVMVRIENGLWHLSISTPAAQPSYKEIKEARYRFIPDDVTMAQIFPSKSEFVNLHPYCHHLWQIENDKE